MGGRGTFASGNSVAYTYYTTGNIEGVKVLSGLNGQHSLPEEAHSSLAYIKLKPNGTFHEMRIYDNDHYLLYEIAYHPESKVGPKGVPVLHYHVYRKDFSRTGPIKLSKAMKKHFKKYFVGVTV